jgi:DHA3 family macrolide efflux protein-like MFS transporter
MERNNSLQFINRDFSLMLVSRFISQFGDKIFLPAILWLALTSDLGSVSRLGLISITLALPPLLSILIGVYVDRVRKKRLMVFCDLIRFVLCIAVLFNQIFILNFWVLVALIFAIELFGQFFSISSSAFIPHLVKKEDYLRANSYFTGTENITSIVGYAAGGVLIATIGTNWLILLNGISFLLSGLLLMLMKTIDQSEVAPQAKTDESPKQKSKVKDEILNALKIVFLNRVLKNLIITFLIINFSTASLEMLITIWSNNVLGLGSKGFGLLLTSILIGSLLGSVILNFSWMRKFSAEVTIAISTLVFGVMISLLSQFPEVVFSLITLFVVGIAFSILGISFTTLIMNRVAKEHLGKVGGIIQTAIRGGHPIGISIVTGSLAILTPHAIFLAIGCIIFIGGLYLTYLFMFSSLGRNIQDAEQSTIEKA